MKQPGGRGWLAASGLLAAFVVDRWLIHRSTGHLLFHVDGAEYFYLLAMAPFEGQSTLGVLSDPHSRESFLRCCLQVADLALHGSTIPPGIVLHAALEHAGLSWSTATLKGAALGYATITVALWLVLLGRTFRSPGAAWRFGALALLGPAVFVKLNLLHWGTHEQVMLWHAVLLLVAGRWLTAGEGKRGGGALAALGPLSRMAVLGLICAGLALLNFSLLIPGLFTLAWIGAGEGWRRWGGRGLPAAAGASAGLVAAGLAVSAVAWWGMTRFELIEALGFQAALWRNDKVGEALTLASFHGPWEAVRTAGAGSWSLFPGLGVALAVLGTRVVRRSGHRIPAPLLFLAAYLVVAWLTISVLPVAYDQAGVLRPRFLAHLWPVSFAVIALWCAQGGDWIRRGALLAVLLLGLPVQWTRLDLGNLRAGSRYDAARLFELTYDEEGALPEDRVPLADASDDFILGLGVLRPYQTMEYWDWTPPRRAARMDHAAILQGYPGAPGLPPPPLGPDTPEPGAPGYLDAALAAAGVESEEFYRGVGYAYRVLLPPSRRDRLEPVLAEFPAAAVWIREGYEWGWRSDPVHQPHQRRAAGHAQIAQGVHQGPLARAQRRTGEPPFEEAGLQRGPDTLRPLVAGAGLAELTAPDREIPGEQLGPLEQFLSGREPEVQEAHR